MAEPISLLVVDDDDTFRRTIDRELCHMGFDVETASSGVEALAELPKRLPDVVLLDIRMPGRDGVSVLEAIREEGYETEVIMLTGHGSVANAVDVMKLGAFDYLVKPCSLDDLELTVKKAFEKRQISGQNAALRQGLARAGRDGDIIGESAEMCAVWDMVSQVAPSDSTILIYGESGVGKEVVARAIHRCSKRSEKPFVVIDCTSLQECLLESELFGHERGAYTGATTLKHGLFEVADGGTILLDELSEVAQSIQAKLLRALETGSFRRVGATRPTHVDVRVLAATNRNLRSLVEEGSFRQDLFYRLNVVSITVPPLRARPEDIPLFGRHFVTQSRMAGNRSMKISEEATVLLRRYNWPGNVRELRNVIERAVLLSKDEQITPLDLPENLRPSRPVHPTQTDGWPSLRAAECRYVAEVLKSVGGHRAKAADILGISERQLYRKIKDCKLGPE